ncbi:MAG: glutaredoxin domain-containing protein [Candidatus Neomarinimicrobiota bacterium]|nr:glutaredoxin domain-containing protein [Candidatus Neomarinimicrobiota bacterium]MEC9274558.1 glutaredoxin domain-containing protein [Candidatus Neomarinimicrobiota bacterium]
MTIIIYSTEWCVPCKNAKQLLDDKNVVYKEIDIEQNKISRDDLYDITGGRSVPQIMINEKVIGGYSELFYLNQSGELDKLLEDS